MKNLVFSIILSIFICTLSSAQEEIQQEFSVLITNTGSYQLEGKPVKKSELRNLLSTYLRTADELYILLSMENRVQYDKILKFRKTILKPLDTPDKHLVVKYKRETDQSNLKINGKLINQYGEPAGNISVIAKGTSSGLISQSDGSFSIDFPTYAKGLVFSRKGFRKVEIKTEELCAMSDTEDLVIEIHKR